jgi:hypothetical protein
VNGRATAGRYRRRQVLCSSGYPRSLQGAGDAGIAPGSAAVDSSAESVAGQASLSILGPRRKCEFRPLLRPVSAA